MKALITGATGFLGGALTRRVKSMGWDVTALGRNASKLGQFESEGIRALQIDLKDKNALADACKNQEIVFIAPRCLRRGEILNCFIRLTSSARAM